MDIAINSTADIEDRWLVVQGREGRQTVKVGKTVPTYLEGVTVDELDAPATGYIAELVAVDWVRQQHFKPGQVVRLADRSEIESYTNDYLKRSVGRGLDELVLVGIFMAVSFMMALLLTTPGIADGWSLTIKLILSGVTGALAATGLSWFSTLSFRSRYLKANPIAAQLSLVESAAGTVRDA